MERPGRLYFYFAEPDCHVSSYRYLLIDSERYWFRL
jgi:hypothetical protein